MIRRMMALAGLAAVALGASACFSLDWDENVRMLDHYGKSAHEMRVMTNKYFFDFDSENPFED